MNRPHHHKRFKVYASIVGVALAGGIGYWAYSIFTLSQNLVEARQNISQKEEQIKALEQQNEELGGTLSETARAKEELDSALKDQKKENEDLEEENEDISDKADMYKKLATYDKQLLAKYSKVYFLNENYKPTKLDTIDATYTLPVGKTLQFLDPALPFLEDLLKDANKESIPLRVVSAYRSFEEQEQLKSNYKVVYGAGTANAFSADQGYSEHQLGTTVDFTTPTLVGAVPAFANSSASAWLLKNAYRYGFILSYPQSNSYYMYEPWHWRFVGVDLATDLHKKGENFYDMDQREIDEYLIKTFE